MPYHLHLSDFGLDLLFLFLQIESLLNQAHASLDRFKYFEIATKALSAKILDQHSFLRVQNWQIPIICTFERIVYFNRRSVRNRIIFCLI